MNFGQYEREYGVTKYKFIEVSRESKSAIEASVKLKMPYKTYAKVAKKLECFKDNPKIVGEAPLDEVLEGLHPNYSTTKLKERLIDAGIKECKCEWCEITQWRNLPITLELDHINGNNSDHRLENLRVLCPNCHSQTDTFRNRKRSIE